jgi:VWFA-related protein
MFTGARLRPLLLLSALCICSTSSAQDKRPANGRIYLDVVVIPKSGPPVSGLQQQDFTLLDNKVPQPIVSFRALGGSQAPLEVVVLVDAVNTNYSNLAYQRGQIDKFLRANGGRLPYPTTLAIFTDMGTQLLKDFSTDGNALSAALDSDDIGLRILRRSEGFYGAEDRLNLSLQALNELAAREAPRPGRKIILWVSPGWAFLSGPEVFLDGKQQQGLFATIVNLSNQLLQAHITLYSVDPLGTADTLRTFYYQDFLKGVAKPSQVQPGNLALQVIATQSGGLALNSNNDVDLLLQKCIEDTQAYYELSFDPPLSDERTAYHQLEVRVDKHGLTARTRQGYYSPTALASHP